MRRSFDGLSGLVSEVIKEDPMSGHLFVFFNKRKNLSKTLWWDRSGYLLLCDGWQAHPFTVKMSTRGRIGIYTLKGVIYESNDSRGHHRCLLSWILF